MSQKSKGLTSVPLMFAFRDAFQAKDAKVSSREQTGDKRVISKNGGTRFVAVGERELRNDLAKGLANLVNTISLDSTEGMNGLDRVSSSILNFGISDISYMTLEEVGVDNIKKDLREKLLAFEPRLMADTLIISRSNEDDEINQKVKFDISSELFSRPHNLILEFSAEVDPVSGKVRFSRLGSAL